MPITNKAVVQAGLENMASWWKTANVANEVAVPDVNNSVLTDEQFWAAVGADWRPGLDEEDEQVGWSPAWPVSTETGYQLVPAVWGQNDQFDSSAWSNVHQQQWNGVFPAEGLQDRNADMVQSGITDFAGHGTQNSLVSFGGYTFPVAQSQYQTTTPQTEQVGDIVDHPLLAKDDNHPVQPTQSTQEPGLAVSDRPVESLQNSQDVATSTVDDANATVDIIANICVEPSRAENSDLAVQSKKPKKGRGRSEVDPALIVSSKRVPVSRLRPDDGQPLLGVAASRVKARRVK